MHVVFDKYLLISFSNDFIKSKHIKFGFQTHVDNINIVDWKFHLSLFNEKQRDWQDFFSKMFTNNFN
jgi:hypothetical protein